MFVRVLIAGHVFFLLASLLPAFAARALTAGGFAAQLFSLTAATRFALLSAGVLLMVKTGRTVFPAKRPLCGRRGRLAMVQYAEVRLRRYAGRAGTRETRRDRHGRNTRRARRGRAFYLNPIGIGLASLRASQPRAMR